MYHRETDNILQLEALHPYTCIKRYLGLDVERKVARQIDSQRYGDMRDGHLDGSGGCIQPTEMHLRREIARTVMNWRKLRELDRMPYDLKQGRTGHHGCCVKRDGNCADKYIGPALRS